jgi:hypothetical protein
VERGRPDAVSAVFIPGDYQPGRCIRGAIGLRLHGKDTIIWLRSKDYTVDGSIAARGKQQNSPVYVPLLVEGQSLTLDDMADGRYTVFWYDPQSAEWLEKAEVSSVRKTLTIPIPAFRSDLAAKIVRNP